MAPAASASAIKRAVMPQDGASGGGSAGTLRSERPFFRLDLLRDIDVVLGRGVMVGRECLLAAQPQDTFKQVRVVVNRDVGYAHVGHIRTQELAIDRRQAPVVVVPVKRMLRRRVGVSRG